MFKKLFLALFICLFFAGCFDPNYKKLEGYFRISWSEWSSDKTYVIDHEENIQITEATKETAKVYLLGDHYLPTGEPMEMFYDSEKKAYIVDELEANCFYLEINATSIKIRRGNNYAYYFEAIYNDCSGVNNTQAQKFNLGS